MKKQYKHPVTDIVRLNINGTLLDAPIINNSHDVTDEGLAKENNFDFDDDAFGDIWGAEDDTNNLWNKEEQW